MSSTDRTPRTPRTSRTAPRRQSGTTAVLERDVPGPADGPGDSTDQPLGDAAQTSSRNRRRSGRSRNVSRARGSLGSPAGHTSDSADSRTRTPRHRLLLVCTGILAVGLLGVLMLKTVISQGAFHQHELEIDLILLAEKEEKLAREVQQAESPVMVERKARALGMVPAAAPVFLRLADGTLLGEPVPAPQPTAPVDFDGAPGPRAVGDPATSDAAQPSPSPGPTSSAAPGGESAVGATPSPAPSPAPAPGGTPEAEAPPVPQPTPTPTPTSEGANQ